MTEDEITAFQASAGHGHKPTWRFGGGPVGAAGRAARMNNPQAAGAARRTGSTTAMSGRAATKPRRRRATARACRSARSTRWACRTTPTACAVRERYGVLVKQYHPDSNGGDRSMEHRLHVVIRAFKALKSSGLA